MTPFQHDVAVAQQPGEPVPSLVAYFHWQGSGDEYPPCYGRYEKRHEFDCLTGPFAGEGMCVDPSEVRQVTDDEFIKALTSKETSE